MDEVTKTIPVFGGYEVIGFTNFKQMGIRIHRMRNGIVMKDMKFKRNEILEKVKLNREKHRAEYVDAVKDYKILAIERVKEEAEKLSKRIDELRRGERLYLGQIVFNLQVPEDHTQDYDQVIMMLEMCVEDELIIGQQEFACYVRDEWDWQERFRETYHSNKTSAMMLTSNR